MKLQNLFFLTIILTIGSISAYTATIHNRTDGQIVAHVEYVACGPDSVIIESGQSREVKMAACCAKYVTAQATSGKANGAKNSIKPPIYGLPGMTCASIQVEVSNSLDSGIILQASIQ